MLLFSTCVVCAARTHREGMQVCTDAALQQVVAMEREQQELRARMERMQVCVCVGGGD